jgi:hypothetical protein
LGKLNLKRIDPEIIDTVKIVNLLGMGKTIASCSGHGKYHPTIIVKTPQGHYLDYYSCVEIQPIKRRYLCFYQRDNAMRYFIPQVEDFYKKKDVLEEAH